MPTENRSSNTEMVSVPRHWAQETITAGPGECVSKSDIALLSKALSRPAPQHPDPIAWMVGTAFWWTKEEAERDAAETGLPIVGLGPMAGVAPAQHQGEPVALPAERELVRAWGHDMGGNYEEGKAFGWNACLDEIAKLGPLYTHADPAEVERLREELDAYEHGSSVEASEADNLRKQLAEAHALMRDIELTMDAQEDSVSLGYDIEVRMATILRPSASAEPSVAVEIDERGSGPTCKICDDLGDQCEQCRIDETFPAYRAALERKPSLTTGVQKYSTQL